MDQEFVQQRPGLAAALRVSPETIYRLIRSGELDCIRAGTSIRVPESAIRDYLRVSPGAELAFPGRQAGAP
jgi:excisionase family DNA binding protein